MTNKQIKQLLVLDVILGFASELAKHGQASPRTVAQAVRLENLTKRTLKSIGAMNNHRASKETLARFDALKKTIYDHTPVDIDILDYCNALLFMLEVAARHAEGTSMGSKLDSVFESLQVVYETMDPDLEDLDSMAAGTELGHKMWSAIVSNANGEKYPDTYAISYGIDYIHEPLMKIGKSKVDDIVGEILNESRGV